MKPRLLIHTTASPTARMNSSHRRSTLGKYLKLNPINTRKTQTLQKSIAGVRALRNIAYAHRAASLLCRLRHCSDPYFQVHAYHACRGVTESIRKLNAAATCMCWVGAPRISAGDQRTSIPISVLHGEISHLHIHPSIYIQTSPKQRKTKNTPTIASFNVPRRTLGGTLPSKPTDGVESLEGDGQSAQFYPSPFISIAGFDETTSTVTRSGGPLPRTADGRAGRQIDHTPPGLRSEKYHTSTCRHLVGETRKEFRARRCW